ncbi:MULTISPECIES: hypothetical protein [unclassified Bradyrhizobium]
MIADIATSMCDFTSLRASGRMPAQQNRSPRILPLQTIVLHQN